jgi:arylsulfatase A-like enzyme
VAISNVICLVIDRLHAGYLGAYGNTWIRTPTIDRLAAESFVFDRAIIDSPNLRLQYDSLWMGMHVLCPKVMEAGAVPMAKGFSQAGRHTTLITDSTEVAEHPLAAAFDERIAISQTEGGGSAQNRRLASSVEDTEAASFFASAIDWLQTARKPFLFWLHTETLGRVWDAPLEFRQQYGDEDDPAPNESADVPNRVLSERFDPDEVLGVRHAYAGQVTLLDELIAALLEAIDGANLSDDTLLVLFSPRGFPLGEHRRLGPCDEALYAELTHVPWLIRFPAALGLAGRTQALVQSADLPTTILDACGLPIGALPTGGGRSAMPLLQGDRAPRFDRAFAVGPAEQYAVVTPAWSLRVSNQSVKPESNEASSASGSAAEKRVELFTKPDDWFEVNEVSDLCPEIAEKMQTEFTRFEQACAIRQPVLPVELPDELATGLY